MLKFLKKLFEKADDITAYNCEVYIHKETAELYVLNAIGKLEGDISKLYMHDVEDANFDAGNQHITLNLDRDKFEYLGSL